MFAVGVLRLDVCEQRGLVQEDLGAVDALQVCAVRQLRVSGHHVLLQLVRQAEGLLAVITHVQVLVQLALSHAAAAPGLLAPVPLRTQRQVLSVLAVSL